MATDERRNGPDGQRRYLTLLFADLSDSTRLGELMEAEHYAAMLAELRHLCREIVPRHGGHIARIQGDGLLAFFGWPDPGEDDGRRAAEAALDLHSAVARLSASSQLPADMALRLHSGVHAGLVLVSEGDVERGRFELLGNVPNIAARLSALAEKDDIVVSEETLGPHLRFFTTGERQTVRVRGREAPLTVYRVLGRAATRNRFEANARRGLSPFVGREQELRALRGHLHCALAGGNVCCVVSALPGMGKSRLIEELVHHATDERCCTLRGYCEGYLGAVPLQPFLQILAGLFARADAPVALEPALVASARALLSGGLEQQGDRAVATLHELFAALAAEQPLLLVLDDWQWADEASQKVLEGLRTLARPLCVLLATRTPTSELLLARPAATLQLEPLDAGATARVMDALLPGADPFVVADIHRYAGGIPLYIEELCHAAQVPGSSWQAGLKLGGSAWLSGLIESRVGRLPAAQAEIVRAAAVIGNVFPAWLLEHITGHGADHPAVRALAEFDLVFAGEQSGTLRFKHGITRDVIYAGVGLYQRQRMHRMIAEALAADGSEPDQHVEALAYHCAAGGQAEPAARHAERAGDKAMAASALDRARAQYVAALAAIDGLAPLSGEFELRWCGVVQKLGLACVFDPLSLADSVALFERGVALARRSGRLEVIARAEYWLGYVHYAKGRAIEAQPHCEAALDLALQVGDERLAAQARAVYGQVLLSATEYARALPLLDAGLNVRRKAHPANRLPVGAAYTLACKGCLLGDRGRFAEAEECFSEALRLVADTRHQVSSSVRHWRSVVLQWQGRWEEALRMADDSADIAEYTRSRHQLSMGRAMAGYVRWVLSRRSEDLQALREATAWIEARKGGLGMSLNHSWMVEAALASGHEDEARYHAARLFMRSRQADRLGEALGCRALARTAAKLNHFARAERYLARAAQAAAARGSVHEHASNQLCEAQIRLDRGQVVQARALLDQAMSAFESMAMLWHLERARRLAYRA